MCKQMEEQQMELIEMILSRENMLKALKSVKQNKGAAGIDKVTVDELDGYFQSSKTKVPRESIR